MKLFNKVAIVGVGLIGGSIALALRKQGLCARVVGVSRHKKSLLLAKKMHAINKGSQELNIIKGADLVILATPVKKIISLAPLISNIIKKDCLVTDVGSTKEEITKSLTKIFPYYVGSHPLAGSEKRGIINAHPDIFKGSLCILTPTKNTSRMALNKLKLFWNKLGARAVLLSPATHDKILSFVSHLPHIVAFSLIGIVPKEFFRFASSGLKDTTRIAASDRELWTDIFLSNRKNTVEAIELFKRHLSRIKSAIKKGDKKILSKILKEAKNKRDNLV
jgi:prephenate dehydrogenase